MDNAGHKTSDDKLEVAVATAVPAGAIAIDDLPIATPVSIGDLPADAIPVATPISPPANIPTSQEEAPSLAAEPPSPPRQLCPVCRTPRVGDSLYCPDCGLMFSSAAAASAGDTTLLELPIQTRLAGRYEAVELLVTRGQVRRYRGLDHSTSGQPQPIMIVQKPCLLTAQDHPAPLRKDTATVAMTEPEISLDKEEPSGEPDTLPRRGATETRLSVDWPGPGWEWRLLQNIQHSAIPRAIAFFNEDGNDCLVEEAVTGQSLWDAWDDATVSWSRRFEWLAQLAEGLKMLHEAGAIVEGLRPDFVVVTPGAPGRAVLADLSDLLPLPLRANAPIQGGLYTAPELVLGSRDVDFRADLYGFGAMLYALYLGRELTEMDFERQGVPKSFVLRFPDAHPGLARVIKKTFVRTKEDRFPTEECRKEDPTGFHELIQTLRAVGLSMSGPRLDIAGWTTTGMVRTGNEDAFTFLHAVASKHDRMGDQALVILADGMGGYEAGEVASALAIDSLRSRLLQEKLFAGLIAGAANEVADFNEQTCRDLLADALQQANRQIHAASCTPDHGERKMGCTAEVVYIDGGHMVVGHVGDSRVYHYTAGRLVQLTRDHTLVNRLVELGHLSPEEAQNHPRRHELQQALGGRSDVDPDTHHAELRPGDWLIVCSDGLPSHVDDVTLTEIIQRADSAEMCARRLVNLANFQGAMDNCTVVAVRAT